MLGLHNRPDPRTPLERAAAGELLRERHQQPMTVLYLQSGRVQMGLREDGVMRRQLGSVQGPCWLDAATALLDRPNLVDMVAETAVQLRRVPLDEFRENVQALPEAGQELLRDMALGYCQQTELAISRLAQDAEARCAQWLLRHAHNCEEGGLRVTLHLRKRMIAAQLGIAPETLSRVLRQLREHGLIVGTGNVLRLPQPRALQVLAGA